MCGTIGIFWFRNLVSVSTGRRLPYDVSGSFSYKGLILLITADTKAVMAMTTIGLIFFILSFVMVLLYMFIHSVNKNILLILFTAFAFAAGQCFLLTRRGEPFIRSRLHLLMLWSSFTAQLEWQCYQQTWTDDAYTGTALGLLMLTVRIVCQAMSRSQ